MSWDQSDPDAVRAEIEAEKADPNYEVKQVINEIEIHLRYGLPTFKFIGWLIVALLALILWRIW